MRACARGVGTETDAGGVGSHARIQPPYPHPLFACTTTLRYSLSMLHTGAGPLPRHTYCYVEPDTFGNPDWLRVAWFGLVSHPGRTWGCHVMLECGAVYRNVPLHKLAHKTVGSPWVPGDAQTWDCYGIHFSTTEYPFLEGTRIRTRLRSKQEHVGTYMFTVIPMLDGFSLEPEQGKEFYFIKLDNGRFTAQPTNHLLVQDKSFITESNWPKLKRQTEIWSVDNGNEV